MTTILIVDDHAINRQFLHTLLGYGGHSLLEAADGTHALSLAISARPDLVITDILMPNMDGFEFITRMRAVPALANVPVIFYTASYRTREANIMAKACGVKWVLSKPAEPELILQTVQEALGKTDEGAALAVSQISASIESDKFSAINQQLLQYIGALENASDMLLQKGDSRASLEAERFVLHNIATKLTASLDSLQQVSMRLTRLVELGLDLAAERDPARMLEIACRAAQVICSVKYAAVAVLEMNEGRLGPCFTRGMDDDIVTALRALPVNEGVLGKLLEDAVPCRLNKIKGTPPFLGLPASHPPINSFLGNPISSKDRTFGWLYVADKLTDEIFTEVDEQILATIASQLAAAYENIILYEKVDQHRGQLQMEVFEREQAQDALRKTLRARTVKAQCNNVLVHAVDEKGLVKDMCQTIVNTSGYSAAWVGCVEGEDAVALNLIGHAGLDGIDGLTPAEMMKMVHWHSVRNAICEGRQYLVNDSLMDSALPMPPDQGALPGYRSALSLPLMDADKVFGVFTIYHHDPNEFEQDQVELFEELAGDISYGVVNQRARRARENAEAILFATQEKLSGILNSIDNIVWSASEEGFIYLNPVAEKVYGRPLSDFYENKALSFSVIHPDDQERIRQSGATLRELGVLTREYRILRPDGSIRWLEDRTKAVHDGNGHFVRLDGVASDITERKKYEAHIEYLATHDPLTSLANRNLLHDRLTQGIALARRSGLLLALLFIDLDHFKEINDTHGHATGDALLTAVSHRLRSVVREIDTIARPGGDEFIVLLSECTDAQVIANVANKLLMTFATPFDADGIFLPVTASVGVSVFPNDGLDIEALLRSTDAAMYSVKERGGNGLQMFAEM